MFFIFPGRFVKTSTRSLNVIASLISWETRIVVIFNSFIILYTSSLIVIRESISSLENGSSRSKRLG